MAKINVTASAYRVARGKGEMARDKKWQKTAKLTTKKDRELKKHEPAGKGLEETGSSVQGQANEPIVPAAPDKIKSPK